MRASSPNSFVPYVWDQNNDVFDSTQLASNWDAIDAQLAQPRTTNAITQIASLPTGLNNTTDRGKLYYLTATDQGFPTGTIVRWGGSAWNDVKGVELLSTLPSSNNFDGRLVLLTAANGGFSAWTLVRYLTGSWYQVNQGIEIVGSVPVSNNFAGRVVILSAASGAFNAYDVIRYDGSSYAKVGPAAIPPGTELAYFSQTTDLPTTNAVAPGDTITTFSAATFENVKYYFEIDAARVTLSSAGDISFQLREGGSNVGNPITIAASATAEAVNHKVPFTPSAGSHTYLVTWYVSTGTGTLLTTGLAPALFRIFKG